MHCIQDEVLQFKHNSTRLPLVSFLVVFLFIHGFECGIVFLYFFVYLSMFANVLIPLPRSLMSQLFFPIPRRFAPDFNLNLSMDPVCTECYTVCSVRHMCSGCYPDQTHEDTQSRKGFSLKNSIYPFGSVVAPPLNFPLLLSPFSCYLCFSQP